VEGESMAKPAFIIGRIAPTPGLVNQFFNVSTGIGDNGEIDTRGPWNEGDDWVFTESPALQASEASGAPSIVTESSPPEASAGLDDLLVDQLRDILHAEKQLTKALPKMAEAARFDQLRELLRFILRKQKARSSGSMNVSSFSERLQGRNRARVCRALSRRGKK
jgi:Mn-containing catalase